MSNECHETATVTEVLDGNSVQVVVKRSEACGACSAKGACQALGGQTKDFFMVLDNTVNARVGDVVRITLSESAVIQASAILYLVPALCLLGLALLGSFVAPLMRIDMDTGAIFGAIGGLAAGFGVAWALARKMEKNNRSVPAITRVVSRSE